jgi:hypothetical protein
VLFLFAYCLGTEEDIFFFLLYMSHWSLSLIEVSSIGLKRDHRVMVSMKKGLGVWVFGFLTFLMALHTFDAYLSLTSGEASRLLELYAISHVLIAIDAGMYFWGSLSLAFVFLGVTSLIACHNPIMALYNKILADIELAEGEIDKASETETSLLDMINHSLTSNSVDLHAVKEGLKAVKESQNGLRVGIAGLTRKLSELEAGLEVGFQKLEADLESGTKCPFCGKDVLPQFKLCPYCGENLPYALMQIKRP